MIINLILLKLKALGMFQDFNYCFEISVLMAQFPSKEIAQLSYNFRTLGLGYANLGSLLMQQGIPYDSNEAFAICGALTAIMHMTAYATSAEMAMRIRTISKL